MLENSTNPPIMPGDKGAIQQTDPLKAVRSCNPIEETNYQDIFEHSPNGIYQSTPDGQFLRANPALAQIYGYESPDELIESISNIATQLYVDEHHRAHLLERLQEEQQLCGFETQVKRKDGSILWILESSRAVRDQEGRIRYYEGTIEDITERKYTEGLLRQQIDKERLLSSITLRIRQSIDLDEILQTTVDEVRELLDTDRVFVCRFNDHGDGYVPVESIRNERLSIIDLDLQNFCFEETSQELFLGGRISAISDIRTSSSPTSYVKLLEQLSVIASLVVPIVKSDRLLGLLIAHHCTAPRQWQPWEVYLLQQLAAQVAIAAHQSELYQQLQTELA
ncbi:MAG: PAS domain S-box protein, partial [Symploca sp. SIO2B6]|nr:PAS domain S-box protein [Symploca sp. SIO2B6]